MLMDIIRDSLLDSVRLVPFLFLTYLVMEWLEHRTGERVQRMITKSGRFGPLVGAFLGVVPQCGFSAAASNLYAGRVITLGTLFAVYLSTSDEMLPVLLSESAPPGLIIQILLIKVLTGLAAGFLVDGIIRRDQRLEKVQGDVLCGEAHCHCGRGIVCAALQHTLQIAFFVLLVNLALNGVIAAVGEETLSGLLFRWPVVGEAAAGLVGLLPNCAASVVITQLYLEGTISFGAMLSGLLTGSGIGVLVLFRVNRKRWQNVKIVSLLYVIGVSAGLLWGLVLGR